MSRRRLVLLPLLLALVAAVVLVRSRRDRRTGIPPASVVESSAPDAFGAAVAEVAERGGR